MKRCSAEFTFHSGVEVERLELIEEVLLRRVPALNFRRLVHKLIVLFDAYFCLHAYVGEISIQRTLEFAWPTIRIAL